MSLEKRDGNVVVKALMYIVCIFLAILSLLPFIIMFVNATRSTVEIQAHQVSLIPSTSLIHNFGVISGKTFKPWTGFVNSLIISSGSTVLTLYFSTLTAYALVAYRWKLRNAFFGFILAVMMIPGQITAVGFLMIMYRVGLTNNFIPLIVPAIAAPSSVFFMRQFMMASLPLDLLDSARIDGSSEFRTFNQIAMPIMKPALATQGIFCFVGSWNNLFLPSLLLTKTEMQTMPVMVSLLKGDMYRTDYGAIYLALSLTVLPLFIVYFTLSKYIIAGVALGGVKG